MKDKMLEEIIKIFEGITEVSLYCLIFIIPFSKAGIEIFATIAIIGWLIKQIANYRLQVTNYFPKTPLNLPLFTLFIISFISMLFSVNINLSLKGLFLKLSEYIMIFFICVDIFSKQGRPARRFKILVAVILTSVVFLFADAGFQWVRGRDLIRGFAGGTKLKACFDNENDFAGYIITILPVLFCMIFVMFKNLKFTLILIAKFASVVLFLVGLIVLGKTLARGAWIGYLISVVYLVIVVFLFIKKGKREKVFVVFAIFCVCVSLILGLALIKSVKIRLTTLTEGFQASWSRVYQWKEAISIIEDFPVFGTGLNTYTKIIPSYSISRISGCYPHNCYLQMAAETGILGLVAFLWILLRFFSNSMSLIKKSGMSNNYSIILIGISAGILASLVHSFFDTNLFALKLIMLFWVMMGIATSMIISYHKKDTSMQSVSQ